MPIAMHPRAGSIPATRDLLLAIFHPSRSTSVRVSGTAILQRKRRGAEQARLRMQYSQRWDGRHGRGKPTLGFESSAELGGMQRLEQSRHEPAGQENAIPGAQRQHQVAGNRTEYGAENFHGALAARIAAGGAGTDFMRLQFRPGLACNLRQGAMDVDQAAAAHQSFVRDATKLRRQSLEDGGFFCIGGCEADVSAFGFEHMAAAIANEQGTDAEAGTRSEHGVGPCSAVAGRAWQSADGCEVAVG